MSDDASEHPKAVLFLVGAMLCYSAVPVFIRYFAGYLDRWCVNAVRYSVGALFWLPFVLVRQRSGMTRHPVVPERSAWRDALLPAAVNLIAQVGYGASPYYVSAPTIGFVLRLSFLFTILLGFLLIPDERRLARSPFFYAGVLVCLIGVLGLFLERLGGGAQAQLVGMAILIGTAVCWAGYAVSVRKCMAGYAARLSFGIISLYTSVGLIVLMLVLGDMSGFARVPGRVWASPSPT